MTQEDIIAIFPLPNVVFFPQTSLPLHIFESRYYQMILDTIENKQLIGMFLLQPGWQDDYYGNPPVFPVGCVGELVSVEKLAGDKFNIVLRGLYRARAIETIQEFPYRKARVEVLPEILKQEKRITQKLQQNLVADFRRLSGEAAEEGVLQRLSDLGETVNSIATAIEFDLDLKMQLLQQNDIYLRGQQLHQLLQRQVKLFELSRQFGRLRPQDPTVN